MYANKGFILQQQIIFTYMYLYIIIINSIFYVSHLNTAIKNLMWQGQTPDNMVLYGICRIDITYTNTAIWGSWEPSCKSWMFMLYISMWIVLISLYKMASLAFWWNLYMNNKASL